MPAPAPLAAASCKRSRPDGAAPPGLRAARANWGGAFGLQPLRGVLTHTHPYRHPDPRWHGRISPQQRVALQLAFDVDPDLEREVLLILDRLCIDAWPRLVALLIDELRHAPRPAAAIYPWLQRVTADLPPAGSSIP